MGGHLALVLLLVAVLAISANGWDVKHSYTSTGLQESFFTPAYSGTHYIYVKAPQSGSITGKIEQAGEFYFQRARADAANGDAACGHGYVSGTGFYTTRFSSECAMVGAGSSVAIAYDNGSTYYQQAWCEQQPEN